VAAFIAEQEQRWASLHDGSLLLEVLRDQWRQAASGDAGIPTISSIAAQMKADWNWCSRTLRRMAAEGRVIRKAMGAYVPNEPEFVGGGDA
jgi:hypothetical protein